MIPRIVAWCVSPAPLTHMNERSGALFKPSDAPYEENWIFGEFLKWKMYIASLEHECKFTCYWNARVLRSHLLLWKTVLVIALTKSLGLDGRLVYYTWYSKYIIRERIVHVLFFINFLKIFIYCKILDKYIMNLGVALKSWSKLFLYFYVLTVYTQLN